MAATDDLLRKIYYNARYGFQGVEAPYRRARLEDRTITKKSGEGVFTEADSETGPSCGREV